LLDGGWAGCGVEAVADFGEVGDHLGAGEGVGEEWAQGCGYVLCGEAGLQELGDDAAAGDEVHHGDGEVAFGVGVVRGPDLCGVVDQAFGYAEGEGRDLVDDDEWVADECGLDGGGAAGDDAGAGVVEGFTGVGDEVDVELF
jgi:hypothetical protein